MSDTGFVTLLETPVTATVLPQPALPAWHAELTTAMVSHLSPAHGFLLAMPVQTETGWLWQARGRAARSFADLSPPDRSKMLQALAVILSDIRRLAESGAALVVSRAWPALRNVADFGHVFAVDGRPVLAGWGALEAPAMMAAFADLDDGRPWRMPPRKPWRAYAASLGCVLTLWMFAGLIMPWVVAWLFPVPPCELAPEQTELVARHAGAETRRKDLQAQLDALTQEVGRRQLLCPLPGAAPHADLPASRWARHDLSMLEGCWDEDDHALMQYWHNDGTAAGPPVAIKARHVCFDHDGHADQTIGLADGRQCSNTLAAKFGDNSMVELRELNQCKGSVNRSPIIVFCKRVSDTQASCTDRELRDLGTVHAGSEQSFSFHRAQ